jgi:hypothetical protein
MDNGELYTLLSEQINNRLDRFGIKLDNLETKIENVAKAHDEKTDRAFDQQTIVCRAHSEDIEENKTNIAIILDRQDKTEKRSKQILTIVGFILAFFNGLLTFFLQKLKW